MSSVRVVFDPATVTSDISHLQQQVGESGALLGDFYYRLYNIDGSINYSQKQTIQYRKQN